jgi:O-antigen ligase
MEKNTTKCLIYITILLIPAYLVRFAILDLPTNLLELSVLIALAAHIINKKSFSATSFKEHKVYFWGLTMLLSGLVISTFAGSEYRTGLGIIKGWFIIPLIFAWVVFKEIKTEEDLKSALKWLYWGIFGVAAISLGHYLAGNLTYDGRLAGIYNSPNYLAMYLAPGIFIGIYLIKARILKLSAKGGSASGGKTQGQNLKLKTGSIPIISSLILILTVFYLTYSYAAWLAVVLSLIITYLIKNSKIDKRTVLASLIILLLIFISQWNTEKFMNFKSFTRSSLDSRITIWQSAGKILSGNPLWGIGPGNFQNKYLEYQKYFPLYLEWAVPQPHNLYLAFWLQAGLLGLAGFLMLVIKWFKETVAVINKQKNSEIAAVLLGIILCVLTHGLADTPYWKNDLAIVFWIVFSLGLIITRLKVNSI